MDRFVKGARATAQVPNFITGTTETLAKSLMKTFRFFAVSATLSRITRGKKKSRKEGVIGSRNDGETEFLVISLPNEQEGRMHRMTNLRTILKSGLKTSETFKEDK